MRKTILALAAVAALAASIACGEGKVPKSSNEVTQLDGSRVTTSSGGSLSVVAANTDILASPGGPALGLTVRATATRSVPAEEATLVVFIAPGGGGPFTTISTKSVKDITDALVALGFARRDVAVSTNTNFGPFPSVTARMPVSKINTLAKAGQDAIEEVVGSTQSAGLRFSLTDCTTPLRGLRDQAFKSAQERAKELAAAAGLTTGAIIAVSEGQPALSVISGQTADPCSKSQDVNGFRASLEPFDAEPVVNVTIEVALTYAVAGGQEGAGITVTGSASSTAAADEAYVVVTAQNGNGQPRPIATKDREAVLEKLLALGIKRDAVAFAGGGLGGPILVSAELSVADAAKLGPKVADAIEEVFGGNGGGGGSSRGIRFGHSNCEAIRGEARKAAIADAKARAEQLAGAAGLKPGGVRGVTNASSGLSPYLPFQVDPCSDDLAALALTGGYGLDLKAFDAPAEIRVDAAVTVSFALGQ
ncbi:MAG: SIMPL domain-containing protein [Dehalococcoidia bacterium]